MPRRMPLAAMTPVLFALAAAPSAAGGAARLAVPSAWQGAPLSAPLPPLAWNTSWGLQGPGIGLSPASLTPFIQAAPAAVSPAAPTPPSPPGLAAAPAAAPLEGGRDLLRAPLWKPTGTCDSFVDLAPGMRPPGSQGSGNTCSVFAAAALGEYLIRQRYGTDIDISERYLYYLAKRDFTGDPELQVYKTIDGLAGFVAVEALQGPLLEERHWRYGDGTVAAPRSPAEPSPGEGLAVGFSEDGPSYARGGRVALSRPPYERFTGTPPAGAEERLRREFKFKPLAIDRRRIKDYLYRERKPVAFNIMVYFDAMDNETGKFRLPTEEEQRLCRESGSGCGGHVILITGYDPRTREYIFRNSWGTSWGKGGYGRLPEAYVLDHCELCSHLDGLAGMSKEDQAMVVNGVHGWSADL
ncbi:MAG: C1 family peptidase [Elusimicrobia bacterium]|nr:C1 family peptidase [Elusimicrobiota bacterium]